MELRVLKYFLMVAREENFTRAAEKLHLSQPTLSRQLREMEEFYGKELFIRQPRRVTLTEDGLLLKKRAEEILSLVAKTENELSADAGTLSGDIRIGSAESVHFNFIADIAKKIHLQYPQVHFHVVSGDSLTTMSLLDKGLVDFVFGYGENDPAKYQSLPLPARDTWGVIMPKASPLASKPFIAPEDLHDKPLILSRQAMSDSTHADLVKEWLQKPLSELNIVASYNLLINGSMLIRAGLGYALAFEHLLPMDEELCFRPLKPAIYAEPLMIWKKEHYFSKAAQYFLHSLKAAFTS